MVDTPRSLADDLHSLVADLVFDDDLVDVDTDLLVEGLVDSMGVVQIVRWLEERLGIEINPADVVIDNFRSVAAMLAYVERRTVPMTP